jgi:prepilin-type N-terminal cleavage/methylation domain-containing protein
MKLSSNHPGNLCQRSRRHAGFTLMEVMIAMSLMILILGGLFLVNQIGLSENQYMASKAGASNTSRYAVDQLISDIHSAKGYEVGSVVNTNLFSFTPITNGLIQGTGLILYPVLISTNESIDYTKYVLYSFDTSESNVSNGKLWRYVSTNASSEIMASNLISSMYFSSENYAGSNQWSSTYKGVIHTTLQFCEFQYPLTMVGSNDVFDYYRIDCRATPHLPDGP